MSYVCDVITIDLEGDFTSLGYGTTVFRRGRLRRVCDGSAVWFIAILSGLLVLLFQLIIVSNVRFYVDDFYRAAVGL